MFTIWFEQYKLYSMHTLKFVNLHKLNKNWSLIIVMKLGGSIDLYKLQIAIGFKNSMWGPKGFFFIQM